MLVDIRSKWRRIAAECIGSYLHWNKPLTKRILWSPPEKVILIFSKFYFNIRFVGNFPFLLFKRYSFLGN